MRIFKALRFSELSMKRKLFGYMLVLVALLLIALMIGLFFFGHFDSVEEETYETLDVQMRVFEKDISTHFDYLAAAGIDFSEDMTALLDTYLADNSIVFDDLTDSEDRITRLQEQMIDPMKQKLLQEDCSGIFVLLDATVNTSLDDSELSKAGIYLQINGYETAHKTILMYRGIAGVGKSHGIMAHRKWRLEFRTDLFPEYDELSFNHTRPLEKSYRITDLFVLPETSDEAVLMVVPMFGSDGTYYGICGFEVGTSYFKIHHARPTTTDHLTCIMTPIGTGTLNSDMSLCCGVSNGYYRCPNGELICEDMGSGLKCFTGENVRYVGVQRIISLSPNNEEYSLVTMIPKADYDRAVSRAFLRNLILAALLLFFAVSCCMYFSRHFLSPILRDLEQLKKDKRQKASSQTTEINDLFAFLAEQDKAREDELAKLIGEKERIEKEIGSLQGKYEEAQSEIQAAQAEISRLAYSRKTEVDPDDYNQFLSGIKTLTSTERKIFDYYLEGKNIKEILVIVGIKESTLRYHNQNIYSKLGVHSLKQMLRYASMMRQQNEAVEVTE